MRWIKKQLNNGLTVVVVPLKTESVTVEIMIRVGSRDETEATSGLSHFLEHVVFKATKKWPTSQIMNQVIESVGGKFNAYTSQEQTVSWVKVNKKQVNLALEFLNQAEFHPLLPTNELKRERGVILEEIKMIEDNPMLNVIRKHVAQVFANTPLGKQVIGNRKSVSGFKRSDFIEHMNKWYYPKNMVLVIAGGVKEESIDQAAKVFEEIGKEDKTYNDNWVDYQIDQGEPCIQTMKQPIQQAHLCLGVRTFKQTDKDRFALEILEIILGGNSSSRMFNEIREKRGLVYYVKTLASSLHETGLLVTRAGCDVRKVNQTIKVILDQYGLIKSKQISSDELSRAKEYFKGQLSLDMEDSQEVAELVGSSLLLEGKVMTADKLIKEIDKVTKTDVQRVAKRIFSPDRLNLTVLGPFESKTKFAKLIV